VAGLKRPNARIEGSKKASAFGGSAGSEVKASRQRRRLNQEALAARVGISRGRLADIEAGRGANSPLEVWFALGEALGRPFRAEFVRDRLEEPADAGHLAIQELVLKLGRRAGFDGRFEFPTRPTDPARSSDASLLDRRGRRLVLVECWNTFGDLGAAVRSSDRKLADARSLAVTLGGDEGPFESGFVGSCATRPATASSWPATGTSSRAVSRARRRDG
jgi:transcriptional regulator with XRE-family HTH domain